MQVLGQVRVWHGTDEIPLGPPGRRAVLGLLVLAGGRPVTRAELVDALWGDAPPTSSANVVQSHVMHLRRALEPTRSARSPSRRICTVGDGYRLVTDDASVDLTDFRDLVAAADRAEQRQHQAEAATLVGDALGRRRVPAWPDVPALAQHRWVVGVGLDRRRALARYVDAMVSIGRGAGVVSAAVADAAEHPLDESAQARLVRAYRVDGPARSGPRGVPPGTAAPRRGTGCRPRPRARRRAERTAARRTRFAPAAAAPGAAAGDVT